MEREIFGLDPGSYMMFLALRAYLKLIRFGRYVRGNDFEALYRKVREHATCTPCPGSPDIARISFAVDLASVFYWKQVFCLQRSAATACLLRDCGVRAEMVMGAQILPFKAHAWVEVAGQVVNDKPDVREIYPVLDRC